MKKLMICLMALALALYLCACQKEVVSTEVGEPIFASFSTTDMEGNIVDERMFAERKLTMINIWGTFCSPCIAEMPDLARLNTAFGDDFGVVGIPIDVIDKNGQVIPDKKAEALSIINEAGADYLHILSCASLQKAYLAEVQSVPQTIFVDGEGRQIGQVYHGAKSYEEWETIIEAMMESLV